jgi:hypothetical protein
MINLDVGRQFYLYQRRLTETPNRVDYFLDLPNSPHLYQYHSDGKRTFGAVFNKGGDFNPCRDFRAYLPKVELN